jgi:hypothetical protein
MDYQNKREMILKAFKWRDDMKKKSDEELYAQTIIVFMFIITLSHMIYIYKNLNGLMRLKIVKEDTINNNNGIL